MEQLGITVRRGSIEKDPKLGTAVYYFLSLAKQNSKPKPGTIGFFTSPKISASLKRVIGSSDFLRRIILDQGRELGFISVTLNQKEKTFRIESRYPRFFDDTRTNFNKSGVKLIAEKSVLADLEKRFKGYTIARPEVKSPVPIFCRAVKAKTSSRKFPRPRRAPK